MIAQTQTYPPVPTETATASPVPTPIDTAQTGGDVLVPAGFGLGFVLLGVVALATARRRTGHGGVER